MADNTYNNENRESVAEQIVNGEVSLFVLSSLFFPRFFAVKCSQKAAVQISTSSA
jgi:hypothetical protein